MARWQPDVDAKYSNPYTHIMSGVRTERWPCSTTSEVQVYSDYFLALGAQCVRVVEAMSRH